MATATQIQPTLITMEQYLRTTFHPDRDFVDGRLERRHLGGTPHGLLQTEVAFWFRLHREQWGIRAITELRTRVSSSRVRLPDVSVAYEDSALKQEVRSTPPLIAIEVLSPKDRLPKVAERMAHFRAMGVQHIWLLDPRKRIAFTYLAAGLMLVAEPRLTVPGTPIYLDAADVFACLD